MKSLRNLASFIAVLLILAVPGALAVAYFRNYSPEGSGHEHGPGMGHDDASKKKKGRDGHAMGHETDRDKGDGATASEASPMSVLHIGAEGFFLNRPKGFEPEPAQAEKLRGIQSRSQEMIAAAQEKIGAAEQQLWKLTGSATPDIASIEATAREVERLRSEQRINFIRTVSEAADLLTPEQKQRLLDAYVTEQTSHATPEKTEKKAETTHKH